MSRGIAISFGLFQDFQDFAILPHEELHCSKKAVSDEFVGRIVPPVGKVGKLSSQSARGFQFGRNVFGCAYSIKHREVLQVIAGAGVEELLRCTQRRDRLRRAIPFERQ